MEFLLEIGQFRYIKIRTWLGSEAEGNKTEEIASRRRDE